MAKRDQKWLDRHVNDPYVQKARQEGYRSRAAYKLLELNQRDAVFKSKMVVVDLGAAPGGWSQVARELVGEKGKVIAIDLLDMDPIQGVTFFQGDFCESHMYEKLLSELAGVPVDLVISDMAPNLSGNRGIDLPRSIYLNELAHDFAKQVLRKGGAMVVKAFHGAGLEAYVKQVKQDFAVVKWRKPKASRDKSNEIYILAKGFLGYNH